MLIGVVVKVNRDVPETNKSNFNASLDASSNPSSVITRNLQDHKVLPLLLKNTFIMPVKIMIKKIPLMLFRTLLNGILDVAIAIAKNTTTGRYDKRLFVRKTPTTNKITNMSLTRGSNLCKTELAG
jgi:hypothetical protein